MKKQFQFTAVALAVSVVMSGCTITKNTVTEPVNSSVTLSESQQSYLENVDLNYSYELARRLEEFKTNEVLGYRTAGSEAEFQTGEMLYEEMQKIGLQEVSKDEFTLDTWTFEKAKLFFTDQSGTEHAFELGGYATQFDTKGIKDFEMLYAGKGTAAELEGLDIQDKLVLIDINQRDEWWINYPAYQAHLKGAAAVIAVQEAGYSEIHPDALNTQDICGPEDAPAFSMSQSDANVLKDALEQSQTGTLTVQFDAKSEVKANGTSYNIVGSIPGKDEDAMIVVSAHYDSYYTGFQDDNAAIGLMMGIAKALIDSGYQPEKTLVFSAMAAEEWGVINSRYDWSTGAYNQIFKVRPEWVGKVVANINFELPAYSHGSTDDIRSVYEYTPFLSEFINKVPKVEGVYEDGIQILAPIQTWSDDFSMAIAGVPSMRNDFSGTFMQERYHSQLDDATTYNESAFLFHHNLYGLLLLEYDRLAVTPLDFTVRMEALKESIDEIVLGKYGLDTKELIRGIEEVIEQAQKVYENVKEINDQYQTVLSEGKQEEANTLYAQSRQLQTQLLNIFKFAEDHFVRLTWEDESIFPHENIQSNLFYLGQAIQALENGEAEIVLDEYLLAIDNNWYAYAFDKEVFDYFTSYVLDQPADRLMWGAGRITGHVDLFDTIQSLLQKYEVENADFTKEIEDLKQAEQSQKERLQEIIDEEIKRVNEMADQLANLV